MEQQLKNQTCGIYWNYNDGYLLNLNVRWQNLCGKVWNKCPDGTLGSMMELQLTWRSYGGIFVVSLDEMPDGVVEGSWNYS